MEKEKTNSPHSTAGYIRWLCGRHPQQVQDAITEEECDEAVQHAMDAVRVHPTVTLTDQESAEVLVGLAHTSKRAYKWLQKAFLKKNVVIAR